jgi:flagellar biogenesis protein FliO
MKGDVNMAEWFGNLVLVNLMFFSFGIWGVRKLLKDNPVLGKGRVSLAKWFFF